MHEAAYWAAAGFYTMTFSDEGFVKRFREHGLSNQLNKPELQRFMKRYREVVSPNSFKYFATGEYGSKNGRPHYHAIIFGQNLETTDWTHIGNDPKSGTPYGYLPAWPYGHTYIGTCETDSALYVASYIQKDTREYYYGGRTPPFKILSQGIGKRYCLDNARKLRRLLSDTQNGVRVGLPRQYREWLGIDPEEYREAMLERMDLEKAEHQYDTDRVAYWMNARQVERTIERRTELWPKGSM